MFTLRDKCIGHLSSSSPVIQHGRQTKLFSVFGKTDIDNISNRYTTIRRNIKESLRNNASY